MKVEFPFVRYNLFYYVYVLSHYPRARTDERFSDAMSQLSAHVNDEGEMIVGAPHRSWQRYAFALKDSPSELATERWAEIRANLG